MPNPNHVMELINMSDNLVEKVTEETELTETVETEQQEAAAADLAEGLTQEPAEEAIETIGLDDLVGETKAQADDEQKEKNKLYAQNRVMSKKLKHLEEQIDKGVIPEEYAFKPQEAQPEPDLADFQSRLYDDFEGDTNLMLAHFNEAQRKHSQTHQSVSQQKEAHTAQLKQQLAIAKQAEESFIGNVERLQKVIPTIDTGLQKAEQLLGETDFNAIRDVVGDNAPLVLGLIGTNKDVQANLMQAVQGGQTSLIKYLTRLEDDAVKRLPQKTISKAPSDTPLSGGTSKTIDYDAEIQKVKNDPKLRGMPAVKKLKELRAAKAALHK